MITQPHPDMSDSIELVEFQVDTTTHYHIRSWKQRLRGTIVLSINGEPITNNMDTKTAVQRAHNNKQLNITIEFRSVVRFKMSGEGVPRLQADQLNNVAHHLNQINTNVDLWPNKSQ